MTTVKPFCWFGSARVRSRWSSAGLPHEKRDTSCVSDSGSGADRVRDQLRDRLRSHGARRWSSSTIWRTGLAGADSARKNCLKPRALIRISERSMSTSSAALTAASRTKSVRLQYATTFENNLESGARRRFLRVVSRRDP